MGRGELVLSPKLFERRRSVRRAERRRRRRITAAVVVLLLVAGAAFTFTRSRFFALTSIEVAGVSILDRDAVIEASGLTLGSNAVGLDLGAAAARVRTVDGVRDARVERDGPLGVLIVVTERRPAVEVRWWGEVFYLDRDAAQVDVGDRAVRGLAVLTLSGARAPRTARPSVTPDQVRGLLKLWRALPAAMRARIGAFDGTPAGGVTFAAGETEVVFGTLERVDEKLRAWRLVRARVRRDGSALLRIDLRVPSRPSVRIA